MVKVAGVDHVCLGSDFDGMPALPVGIENVGKLPAITAALRARGMSPEDVEKILGGNVLRVMEANEK
jgi:membrane dipeptidase